MHNTVVIKGNKSGLTVFLDPAPPFEQLLSDIAEKFRESARFWGSVQMALSLEGRKMTPEEEFAVVNTITENSQIEILCLLDHDLDRTLRCEKALNEKLMELNSRTGNFYKGSLRAGEFLEAEASIVVIGDVEQGSRVAAKGNIIVLGECRGALHAGAAGNEDAVAVALEMAPVQLKIASVQQKYGDRPRRLGKGPMIAGLEDGRIAVKPLKKTFLSRINFI